MIILDILAIILVTVILSVIIAYLIYINKKLNEKIKQEKNRFILYKEKLSELNSKQILSKKELDIINRLARDFFKERFNLNFNIPYTELEEIFKKQGYDERAEFCSIMAGIFYAGQKSDSESVKRLLYLLIEIVEKFS